MIVAKRALRFNDSALSSARTTISERLQNSNGRKIISEQGFVPNSCFGSRRPFLAATACDAAREKIPRSPERDMYNACHSFMNVSMSTCLSYTADIFASALCPLSVHQSPDFAWRKWSSLRSVREMRALRRTPPQTTISAILHTMS